MMEENDSYLLDGKSYNRVQLLDHCSHEIEQEECPGWKGEVLSFIRLFLDPTMGDIIQKTSGTTGDPGKHILQRKALVLSARKTLDFFKLEPGDKALHCLPIKYVAGKLMVVRALTGALDLVLTEPSSRPLRDLKGTFAFAAMVPLQVHESLVHKDDISILSTLLVGGGKLQFATMRKLALLDHPEVYESFGMTETYTHFALRRINGPKPDRGFKVLDGVKITQDQRKCLVVDVKGITSGPLSTNDLVEIDASGLMFKWLGRHDHVIKSGGIKIIPELLEQQIRLVVSYNCLVLHEPDDRLGSSLVLLVEVPEENPPLDKWFEALRAILPAYELPKRIVTVDEIPRNHTMKMDRRAAQKFLSGH